nr:unnamed protein product [Callosobruchus chinensis]
MSQLSSAYRESIILHNNKVEKNRHILKRIISCVKFCSAFDLALRGHDESEFSENQGIFKELINFTAELDNTLKEHLRTATVFKGTSNTIQNEILESMLQVCREEICKQIEKADYLSIQCDKTTDVSNYCQMVLILRYFNEGSICEHFWGFIRIKDKTATGLKTCIENEIDPLVLKTPQKLIAQTYDGANVMSGVNNGVQAQIKIKYPNAHFIHCYAHQLNLIMQKSQNAKVRVFFNNLSAIPVFFSNSSHRCDILQEIINKRLPRAVITRWNYNIRTVNFVHENREKLIEVFEEIESRCEKSITSNEASDIRRALEDPEFIFWLELFHKILPQVDILYNQLQSKNKDTVQLQKDLIIFEKSISNIRNETDSIQNSVESEFPTFKRRRTDDNFRSVIAKEVRDTITTQMKDRFSFRGHLQAAYLFNKDKYSEFAKKFPVTVLNEVASFYPMLSKSRLKTELEIIYSRKDLKEIVGAMNLLSFILENNLNETFIETSKILKIIVTTPMTTAEAERTFSTLKRIKTFLRNTMLNDRLNALVMMSINRNLVHQINNFDDKVMEKFISMKDRRADFNFKK